MNAEDLALFMNSWTIASPAADTNLDAQIDATDLTNFLADFAAEQE